MMGWLVMLHDLTYSKLNFLIRVPGPENVAGPPL